MVAAPLGVSSITVDGFSAITNAASRNAEDGANDAASINEATLARRGRWCNDADAIRAAIRRCSISLALGCARCPTLTSVGSSLVFTAGQAARAKAPTCVGVGPRRRSSIAAIRCHVSTTVALAARFSTATLGRISPQGLASRCLATST